MFQRVARQVRRRAQLICAIGAEHAGQVSADLPLPVLIYHIPQCTRDLGMANVLRLISKVPNIIGLKDSSGDKPNLAVIQAAQAQGPMVFLIGSDDLLLEAIERGAVGSISGIASVCPELVLPIYEALRAGKKEKARALQGRLDEFILRIRDLPSPWAMKLALQVRGLEMGCLAWPMGPISARTPRNSRTGSQGKSPPMRLPGPPMRRRKRWLGPTPCRRNRDNGRER
jgi:4-hydroxy-tetrahydrodipicolinate synthase